MNRLAGKRILVVEDDFLIGAMVTDILTGVAAAVVGPVRTRQEGVVAARTETLDAAVLDVNLRGESSELIAAELERRNIPFVFATGYGEQAARAGVQIIAKPFTEATLLDTVARALSQDARA